MANILVLGGGRVGRAIAIDLVDHHRVTVGDIDSHTLRLLSKETSITAMSIDSTDRISLCNELTKFDIVVNALPGDIGFAVLETIIEFGINVVDISFCEENTLDLKKLAESKKVTAIVDMGIAPGMDNLFLGYHNETMAIDSFECLVGGLPKKRTRPFEYKAPFSPKDVIQEYIRPARYKHNNSQITKPALSDCEQVEFSNIGTLEAFNTDGLRTLLTTMPHIPNMVEKTLRYPGHAQLISLLKACGFFSTKNLSINNCSISPLEFTSNILLKEWQLSVNEAEFTIMRITISGVDDATTKRKTIIYELYDEYDPILGISSMARTTAFSCTAVVNLILENKYSDFGVIPPELIGKNAACFEYILKYLKQRNISYKKIS